MSLITSKLFSNAYSKFLFLFIQKKAERVIHLQKQIGAPQRIQGKQMFEIIKKEKAKARSSLLC